MTQCPITLSNRLENLLLKLQEQLFADTEFRQKRVVVASRGMKRWVKGKLLAARGAFFGINLLTLEEFLKDRVSREALAAHIYHRLPDVGEVADYLEQQKENRVALSIHLTSLFLSYQEIGFQPPKGHWQSKLFELEKISIDIPKGDLYFFGFSHLPKPLLEEIKHYPSYFLSPTLQFWEELKKEEHPLLGSLGKMGRVMAQSLPHECERVFSLPESLADHPAYELTGEELLEPAPLTLLKALQADLLLMRDGERVELPHDQTIEVHVASSIEREVEVLKDRLHLLMSQEGITPGEILVMAKDIRPYLPLLKAHFEKEELPYTVTYQESAYVSGSPVWNLLKDLLHLNERRFQADDIYSFFSSEIVQKALSLSFDEIEGLKTLLEEGAIFWGWDRKDRDSYFASQRVHAGATGSFCEGFERVWSRLLSFENDQIPLNDPLPLSFAEILQQWIDRLKNLRELTQKPTAQSMKEWSLWLSTLIETYFGSNGELFDDLLNRLAIEEISPVPFQLFYHFLEKGVESMEASPGSSEWDAISFTALGPMRAVPKRVIWLLGMEEEHFPSKEPPQIGDLAAALPEKISVRDQDRYAFLETLLSARERLIVSYVTPLLAPPSEGEASMPVQELVSILDRNFLIDGKTFSEVGITLHPRSRFDERPLLSEVDYNLLQPPESAERAAKTVPFSKEIKVKDLLIFARDPAQTYFRHHFETALPYFQAKLPSIEPFAFSKDLKWDIERNKAPPALTVSFEGRAFNKGQDYLKERVDFIASKKAVRVFFEKDCQKPMQDNEGNWVLPPLQIDGWTITGPLGLVSEEGVLIDGDVEDHYPLLLLSQLLPFKVTPAFHSIESKKTTTGLVESAENQLKAFLEGYVAALETPNSEKKSRYSELLT